MNLNSAEHAMSYVWIAVGMILAFWAWNYAAPYIGQTAA
jgi:hypothetical protein